MLKTFRLLSSYEFDHLQHFITWKQLLKRLYVCGSGFDIMGVCFI